jgi:hypothetical protein
MAKANAALPKYGNIEQEVSKKWAEPKPSTKIPTYSNLEARLPTIGELELSKEASFLNNMHTAFSSENVTFTALQHVAADDEDFEIDKNFKIGPEHEQWLAKMPKDYAERVRKEAVSDAHFKELTLRGLDMQARIDSLDNSATAGIAERIIAGVLDPVNLIYMNPLLRTSSTAANFGIGGVVEGGIEYARQELSEFKDFNETQIAVVAALGGALNTVFGKAAKAEFDEPINNAKKILTDEATAEKKLYDVVSIHGVLNRSASDTIKKTADKLGVNYAKFREGRVLNDNVSDDHSTFRDLILSHYLVGNQTSYKAWLKANNYPEITAMSSSLFAKYSDDFGRAYLSNKLYGTHLDPIFAQAAKGVDASYATALKIGKTHEHNVLKHIDDSDGYFHVRYDMHKLGRLRDEFGDEFVPKVRLLLSTALANSIDDVVLRNKIATGVAEKFLTKGSINPMSTIDLIPPGVSAEEFATRAVNEFHLDYKDAIDWYNAIKKPKSSKVINVDGAPVRVTEEKAVPLRGRTPFDYSTVVDVGGRKLSFMDLIEHNVDVTMSRYAHSTAGSVALQKHGLTDDAINKTLKEAERELQAKVDKGVITKDKGTSDLALLKKTFDYYRGIPISANVGSKWNTFANILNNASVFRYLGQTAFTMAAELGSAMVSGGMKGFVNSPSVATMVRIMAGKGDSQDREILYHVFGVGLDMKKYAGASRMDEALQDFEKVTSKIEGWSETAREAQLRAGGIKPLTVLFDAYTTGSLLSFVKKATTVSSLSNSERNTLKALGLDDAMLKKIGEEIKANGVSKNGAMFDWGFEKWDPYTLYKLQVGIKRETERTVQRTDFIDRPGMMVGTELMFTEPIYRLLTGLMSYPITAYRKQILYNAHRGDAQVAMNMAVQTIMLTGAYMVQMSATRSDKDAEKALKPDRIAAAVAQRMTISSIIPQVVDGVATATTGKPLLSTHVSGGISAPGIAAIADLAKVPSNAYKAFEKDKQEDREKAFAKLFTATMSNNWALQIALNKVVIPQARDDE